MHVRWWTSSTEVSEELFSSDKLGRHIHRGRVEAEWGILGVQDGKQEYTMGLVDS